MSCMELRSNRGSYTAELPILLFMLLFLFAFPMIDLVVIGSRIMLVKTAVRQAAERAAVAKTFKRRSQDGEEKSARQIARETVEQVLGSQGKPGMVSGIKLVKPVDTVIVKIPLDQSRAIEKTRQPLEGSRDEEDIPEALLKDNTFNIEVGVTTDIQPFLLLSANLFGKVPGLTAPLRVTEYYQCYCERPAGLFQ